MKDLNNINIKTSFFGAIHENFEELFDYGNDARNEEKILFVRNVCARHSLKMIDRVIFSEDDTKDELIEARKEIATKCLVSPITWFPFCVEGNVWGFGVYFEDNNNLSLKVRTSKIEDLNDIRIPDNYINNSGLSDIQLDNEKLIAKISIKYGLEYRQRDSMLLFETKYVGPGRLKEAMNIASKQMFISQDGFFIESGTSKRYFYFNYDNESEYCSDGCNVFLWDDEVDLSSRQVIDSERKTIYYTQ